MNSHPRRRDAYRHVADEIRRRIAAGRLPPGSPLPSEHALSADFGVARNTVRRALAMLHNEGIVQTVPGHGRFVRGKDSSRDRWSAALPLHSRIADELRSAIQGGRLPPGAMLPSESALMRRYQASRGTVRLALSELEGSSLIITVHGRGRFVRRSCST